MNQELLLFDVQEQPLNLSTRTPTRHTYTFNKLHFTAK